MRPPCSVSLYFGNVGLLRCDFSPPLCRVPARLAAGLRVWGSVFLAKSVAKQGLPQCDGGAFPAGGATIFNAGGSTQNAVVTGTATADDGFYAFVSADLGTLGSAIGSGISWSTSYSVTSPELTPGDLLSPDRSDRRRCGRLSRTTATFAS